MGLGRCPCYSINVAIILCFVLQAAGYLKSSFAQPATVGEKPDPYWVRFLMSLLGALVLGRLSDGLGRKCILWTMYIGCLMSTLAAIFFPESQWPIRSFSFFEQYFGILKAVVGDQCKGLNASIVEISWYFSLLNVACLMAQNVTGFGCLIASSWEGIQMTTLWLQLASLPLLCLVKESGPRNRGNRFALSHYFAIGSLKDIGVMWALGWVSLIALAAFVFPQAVEALVSSFAGSSRLVSLLAGVIGTVITAPAIQSQGLPCSLSCLASFMLLSRTFEIAGASMQHASLIGFFSVFGIAAACMGNALNATLLTLFGSASDLGGLFGIGDAIANFWGIATPALAAGLSELGCGVWTLVGLSLFLSMSLIPYAACAGRTVLRRGDGVTEHRVESSEALL